jgi:hypothetical protein
MIDRRPLAPAGPADRVSVGAHQRLRHVLDHHPQEIRARLSSCLRSQFDTSVVCSTTVLLLAECLPGPREDDAVVRYHPHPAAAAPCSPTASTPQPRRRRPQPARKPRAGTLLSPQIVAHRPQLKDEAGTVRRARPRCRRVPPATPVRLRRSPTGTAVPDVPASPHHRL